MRDPSLRGTNTRVIFKRTIGIENALQSQIMMIALYGKPYVHPPIQIQPIYLLPSQIWEKRTRFLEQYNKKMSKRRHTGYG
jgi:hypothetical protein